MAARCVRPSLDQQRMTGPTELASLAQPVVFNDASAKIPGHKWLCRGEAAVWTTFVAAVRRRNIVLGLLGGYHTRFRWQFRPSIKRQGIYDNHLNEPPAVGRARTRVHTSGIGPGYWRRIVLIPEAATSRSRRCALFPGSLGQGADSAPGSRNRRFRTLLPPFAGGNTTGSLSHRRLAWAAAGDDRQPSTTNSSGRDRHICRGGPWITPP